jgi:hypothetical protein
MVSKLLFSLLVLSHNAEGYIVKPPSTAKSTSLQHRLPLVLRAKKAKRGRLGSLAEDGIAPPSRSRTSNKSKKSPANKKKSITPDGSKISPALAEWMAKQDGDNEPMKSSTTTTSLNDGPTAFFEEIQQTDVKMKEKSSRRVKQSVRKEQEESRKAKIDLTVDALENALEENRNLDDILTAVRQLMKLESGNPRTLLSSKQRVDYRLAWVGSDDAICHIGTGLHNVPLARLQEVFMSCLGRNRIEVSEVIRILGPFPNVRNILQGSTKIGKGDQIDSLKIVMDSMVDGTGKEILAGTEDNIRRVNLQIYFSDERAIVAVVPPEKGVRSDPLEGNGSDVLVFVREDELEEKLDKLRVS